MLLVSLNVPISDVNIYSFICFVIIIICHDLA